MNAISIEARQQLRDRRLSLMRQSHHPEVAQIDAALARIENGTYGECECCGRAIGRQRLRAIPEALLCLDCKAERAAILQ